MDNKLLIILTFVITGLWDVVLRFMSLNYNKLPKYFQMDFVENLIHLLDLGGKYLVFVSSRSVKMRGFSFLSLHAF